MPSKADCFYIESDSLDPYRNLALEEQLLLRLEGGSRCLFLWQNERTVVIGRNQCAWLECHAETLRAEGGTLARRLSGGGAVYHDLGNLNFTFLYPRAEEDIARQTGVIARAAASFGLKAVQTGRNDIEIDGRKFSGNAFYASGGRAFHHGTIMLDVDRERLGRYLRVDPGKYRSKGVASVRARVVNLRELVPGLGVEDMKKALRSAYEAEYGRAALPVPDALTDAAQIEERRMRFSDWGWVYGQPIAFSWVGEERFAWGGLRVELAAAGGSIQECRLYSDGMNPEIFKKAEGLLRGCPLREDRLLQCLAPLQGAPEAEDIGALLRQALA